jgi:hypothetical protein
MIVLCFYVVFPVVGRGLCDETVTSPKESYHASNRIRDTSKMRPCPDLCWSAVGKKYMCNILQYSTYSIIYLQLYLWV